MSHEDVARAGYALKKRGLTVTGGAAAHPVMYFSGVTGEAYLVTGLHPNGVDAVSDLVDALRQAAD